MRDGFRFWLPVLGVWVAVAFGQSDTARGIDWDAEAEAQTVVILHADPDGRKRETTIWLCVSQGQGYVRGGGGRWVGNTLRDGAVALRVGERMIPARAVKVEDPAELERVTADFRSKYGFGDVLATLDRGTPTIFRLEPRGD